MKKLNSKLSWFLICGLTLFAACWCRADEQSGSSLNNGVGNTTISGSVDTGFQFDIQAVPEPSTLAALAVGGVALGFTFRQKR